MLRDFQLSSPPNSEGRNSSTSCGKLWSSSCFGMAVTPRIASKQVAVGLKLGQSVPRYLRGASVNASDTYGLTLGSKLSAGKMPWDAIVNAGFTACLSQSSRWVTWVGLFWLTPSTIVPLFKVFFNIRCVTCNGWGLGWGGVGDVNVPCTWHMFDATQEDAVGCGVWRMMLTFLELVYMFDATQEGAKDTIASEIKTLNTTKKKPLAAGAWRPSIRKHNGNSTKSSKSIVKYHRILTCAKMTKPTKYCKGSQNEESAFQKMHGIHWAANSGVTLF